MSDKKFRTNRLVLVYEEGNGFNHHSLTLTSSKSVVLVAKARTPLGVYNKAIHKLEGLLELAKDDRDAIREENHHEKGEANCNGTTCRRPA